MKEFLVLAAVVIALYSGYDRFVKPAETKNESYAEIANPTYAEMRMQVDTSGRKIDMVLFAKMENESECRERADDMWKKTFESCTGCTFQLAACKEALASRYERLFDNTPISVTYLSLARGAQTERDGRLIFWGVTVAESDQLCNILQPLYQERHKGAVTCVRSHTS